MDLIKELAKQHGVKTTEEVAALNERMIKHIKIEDRLYKVEMLKGRKGFHIAWKLKDIGILLTGQAFDGLKNEDSFIEPPQTFTQLAMILCDGMDKHDVESMVLDEILANVSIKNGDDWMKVDWDEYLVANYSDLIPLLAFALKENFSSFFTGSGMMPSFLTKIMSFLGSKEDHAEKDMKEDSNS